MTAAELKRIFLLAAVLTPMAAYGAHASTWIVDQQATNVPDGQATANATAAAAPAAQMPTPTPAPTANTMKVRGGATISNRLNTTSHPLPLTAPLSTVDKALGDVDLMVEPDDSIRISKASLVNALTPVAAADRIATLSAAPSTDGYLSTDDLAALNMPVTWDAENLKLAITVAGGDRPVTDLNIASDDDNGVAIPVAKTSGYLNVRSAVSYYNGNSNSSSTNLDLDGALRVHGLVFENEAAYRPLLIGGNQEFVREGTRVVWDDRKHMVRYTVGDQQPLNRGFQAISDMAGFGVFRTYEDLDPLRNARPTGTSEFTLQRPSMVETLVNGVPTAQFQLNPGRYNLNNIPYTQGSNNVTIRVTDDLGMQQDINFSLFFDRQLLAKGLTEFAFYAGVPSDVSSGRINYLSSEYLTSGYYRHGFSQDLTAGVNFQADNHGGMAGVEALYASSFGSFGTDVAYSWRSHGSSGYAINASYDRTLTKDGVHSTAFGLSLTTESANFIPPGIYAQLPLYTYQLSANFTHGFSINTTAFAQIDYSRGRGTEPDLATAGIGVTQRLTDRVYLTGEARYEKNSFRDGYGVRVALNYRFGRHVYANATTDTVTDISQVSVNATHGHGVGSWTGTADVIHEDDGSTFDAHLNYLANRAEINLNQSTPFNTPQASSLNGQTTVSLGTSIVMADGHWGIGRPIYDSFVLALPHPTLKSKINLEPSPEGVVARSGAFGPAVDPEIGAYLPRLVTYTAPDAPAGYDVGQGSVRVRPAYHSGYAVVIGSEYNVMAYGRLYFADGKPIPLLAGKATELAEPQRDPVELFTNAQGRFSLTGIKPGRWRIDMPTSPPTSFVVDVPKEGNLINLGDLKASQP